MNEDIKWLADVLDESSWLFYGEFDEYLQSFFSGIFQEELSHYGFNESLSNDFQVAYWSVLSELVKLDLAEYGTSPRGAWLTPNGEKFKEIITGNPKAIPLATNLIYEKYNG